MYVKVWPGLDVRWGGSSCGASCPGRRGRGVCDDSDQDSPFPGHHLPETRMICIVKHLAIHHSSYPDLRRELVCPRICTRHQHRASSVTSMTGFGKLAENRIVDIIPTMFILLHRYMLKSLSLDSYFLWVSKLIIGSLLVFSSPDLISAERSTPGLERFLENVFFHNKY